jgi:uncharacterized damage-inducible protein DinB
MQLHRTSSEILNQLIQVIDQLNDEQYAKSLTVLSGNSIGKHVRHIVEFFECLISGYENGLVDYDSRLRNVALENSRVTAIDYMKRISASISLFADKNLLLACNYGDDTSITSHSSFNREVVYNVEHTIHHMAIIRIAVQEMFKSVSLPENFGIAYSTVKYQQIQCAQ